MLLYQTLAFTMHGKMQKIWNLNYLMDHILCQIFKITLNISLKTMRKLLTILQ